MRQTFLMRSDIARDPLTQRRGRLLALLAIMLIVVNSVLAILSVFFSDDPQTTIGIAIQVALNIAIYLINRSGWVGPAVTLFLAVNALAPLGFAFSIQRPIPIVFTLPVIIAVAAPFIRPRGLLLWGAGLTLVPFALNLRVYGSPFAPTEVIALPGGYSMTSIFTMEMMAVGLLWIIAGGIYLTSRLLHQVIADHGAEARAAQAAQQALAAQQAELTATNAMLRTLVESSPAAIIALDRDLCVTLWNPAAERLFGWREAEVLGRFNPLIPDWQIEEFRTRVTFQQSIPETGLELRQARKDGAEIDVTLSAGPLRDAGGQVFGTIGVFVDRSAQVRHERLLRALNQAAVALARALTLDEIEGAVAAELAALGFGGALLLLDERRWLRAIYLSADAGSRAAIERLIGQPITDQGFPADTAAVTRAALHDRRSVLIEASDLRAILAPLMLEDAVIGVLVVLARDLTDEDLPAITALAHQVGAAWRKADLLRELKQSLDALQRTQAQLIQAQKMEAVGRLAGGIAHDFNNLLTAILGYVQLALDMLEPDAPMRDDLEEIQKAAERATSLTRQLLAFARKQVIAPRIVHLNDLIRDMQKLLRRLIGEDIELLIVPAPDMPPVKVDPHQIEQVLVNLAVNARDSMPAGGTLTIRTWTQQLEADDLRRQNGMAAGAYAALSVRDTGVGLSPEAQAHLFEPFFTTKPPGKGTGLGLATCYGIVTQHGGTIEVASAPADGATFTIYLPAAPDDLPAETQAPEAVERSEGQEVVLIVEDDATVRALAARLLRDHGYTVIEARDGMDALRLIRDQPQPPQLVLTDIVMPHMGGVALVEQLKVRCPGIKVVFMSGYADLQPDQHGQIDQAAVWLDKPFEPQALIRKVREALDRPAR